MTERYDTAQPSDEELRELYVAEWNCAHDNAHEADMAAIRAVREAVEKPLRAEIERLTEERDALRAKLEAAQPSTTRAARVRFTVTAQEAIKKKTSLFRRANTTFFDDMCEFLDYLAAHAVVDVPEGVPSVEELMEAIVWDKWKCCCEETYPAQACDPTCSAVSIFILQQALQHLAPYLQPAASVDPKLCKTPLSLMCNSIMHDSFSLESDESSFWLKYFDDSGLESDSVYDPTDAHRAGMWLLSFAASQGIDVRLPVNEDALAAKGVDSYMNGYREGIEAGRAEMQQASDAAAPAPIADAETLEQLAEIACEAAAKSEGDDPEGSWENCADWAKKSYRDMVTAILRAARPEVDVERGKEYRVGNETYCFEKHTNYLDWINSRIRYRVEVPDEPDSDTNDMLTAAYMYGRHDRKDDTRQQQREEARELLKRLSDSVLTSHVTTRRNKRVQWARMLAELDATLEEKP